MPFTIEILEDGTQKIVPKSQLAEPLRICTCGHIAPFRRLRKHVFASGKGHTDAEWLLGCLIIRGDPKDADRIAELRNLTAKVAP